jgi:TolB-like protein/DNA-binding SARP family transcriptional activator/predicted ATPase/class 3 adenylate cyclase
MALPKSELRLLGPLSFAIDGRELRQLPRKADALLALLALQPGRPIARETVADFLWTDRGPEQARHSLRQTLLVLRHSVGHDLILAEGNCLVIPPGTLTVDAIQFEARAASTDRDVLAEAAALYRGELLENRGPVASRFDDWLAIERSRFAALAATILRRLASASAAAGEIETAIAAAMRLVTIDNLREDSHRLLIELLARAGRRAEALRRFDTVAELLKRELGVRPDDETLALVDRIRRESSGPAPIGSAERPPPGAVIAIAETVPPAVRPPPMPDKPSIAVLPFANMSGDPEQEYFVDGMVEEIITALSRIRWLFVIARNSSFSYKGQSPDVTQVGRELGARYVLEGSVRKAGDRVRITGQLIGAQTGAHLWADRFDGSLEDVFELQEKIASSVAGAIEPALQAAEAARSAGRPTDDLTAYDLYLRAYAMVWSSARQIPEALRLMELAIARDPRYGPALAWAAYCCVRLLRDERSEDREADSLKGADFARRALEVAGDDPGTLANAAQALAYLGEDIGAMMALVDRAVALNPSFARGWHISGTLRDWAGQPKIAIEHAETALRLSPRARVGPSLLVIGAAHFYSRRFGEAVPKLLVAIQEDPSFPAPYRILAACYAHMGRLGDARETVMRLRAITPVVIPDAGYLRNGEHRELFLSGLRLASDDGNDAKPAPQRVDNPPDASLIEPREAERRHITALFCELIGAAAGGDGTGLEDLREAIGDFHRCVLEVAGRHQGFVYRDLGNSALVLFGYPEAHEHDAEQAVRAGLELCAAVRTLRPDADAPLRCRVGIATGMIIVGDLVGAGVARGESIVGNAPNLATRLALSTPPDTVVVELATRGLIGNLFDCRELGAVEAAGGTDPIRSWQVLGKSIVESRFEALRGPALTPLIGRDEEIDLLLRRWARAKTGDGQVVLVSGEPGIGKSRIAAALEERLGGEPHLRLRYFCSPHHQDSALFPFVEQLAHAAGFARDDTSAAKLEKLEILLALAAPPDEDVALLADVLSLPASEQHPLPSLSPQRKKDRTLEALIRQLKGLARWQPVVTVFEDAHWIDPTSRELLDLTVERLRTLPVLLIVTFRPEFQPPWSGLEQVSTLALNRLGRHDRAVLVEQTAGGKALPDEVVAQIAERTDGVPLFVEELTKGVLESGLLREEADRYVLDGALPELAIPMSLHASLLARLDRLAPARQVAQIGAAIGRQFSYALLCAVTRLPEDELQAALTRLVASELVSQRGTPPDAVYSFKHALVQDAAHGSLLRKTRQQLHALIAGALEADSPDIMENQPELLAQHYTEGGLVEKAVAYWGKAGRRSAANSAMAEAAAQFQKGLDQLALLPENPERQQQELEFFCGLGAVLQIVKGFAAPETGHAYARARELWARLDSPSEFLQVPYGQSVYHGFRGELDLAQRLDEDLLRLSSQRNDSAGLVLGHLSSGRNLMYGGRFVASRSHLEAGLALYDPVSHRSLVHQVGYSPQVLSQAFLGIVLFCLGFPDQALARSGTAIAEARRLAHPPSLAVNLGQGARLLSLIGDNAALDERAGELVAVATEQGFSHWRAEGTIFRGWIKVKNGDVAEGISVLRSGSAAYSATGAGVWMPYFLALLAGADEMSGQIQGALTLLDEALRTVELTGERFFAAELNRHKGRLLLRQGYSEVAEDLYRRALSIAEEQGAKLWELRAAVTFARLLRDQGCRGEARDLLAPVYGWFTEGFATPDLREAKALIDELAAPPTRISRGRKPRQSPRPACGEPASSALPGETLITPDWSGRPTGVPGAAIVETVPRSVRPPPMPDKPSIAVLPFANMSGDSEQEYFADGIVEEIITALSRFGSLFVIARNSSFTYKGRAVNVSQVGRELGARYVLEGSVRKSANRVRIIGQLIDALTGVHLWADRFEGVLEDIFDLQDQVTARVVGAIAPKLERAEIERANLKPTDSLSAYDNYLRGMAALYQFSSPETNAEALQLFKRAIELGPDFASAYAMAAQCYLLRKANGWMVNPANEMAEATTLAQRAVALGREDAFSLCVAGAVLAYVVRDLDTGVDLIDRALVLNPNLAVAWFWGGFVKLWYGEPDAAIERFARAMRLSPMDLSMPGMQAAMADAHFHAGRFDEASSWAAMAIGGGAPRHNAFRIAAASNALAGRLELAGEAMARLRQIDPALRMSNLRDVQGPYRRPEDHARYTEAMRKAGLPE